MKTIENGIILSRISYSESSLILQIFTENNGLQSFLFQGAKKKKGQIIFPLAPIQFTSYQRGDSELGKISETSILYPLHQMNLHPAKLSIAFFIADLLSHTQEKGKPDKILFDFLIRELLWLNETDELSNYPLWFLCEYAKYCGFPPLRETEISECLDYQEGKFVSIAPLHANYTQGEHVRTLQQLFEKEKAFSLALDIPKAQRTQCLDNLIAYFQFHLPQIRTMKSLEVLRVL